MPVNATLRAASWRPRRVEPHAAVRVRSFASPGGAGRAAWCLAKHLNWTPDMVKGGALMARHPTSRKGLTAPAGVGVRSTPTARRLMSTAPNPNLALNQFVGTRSGHRRHGLQRGELDGRGRDRRELERRCPGRTSAGATPPGRRSPGRTSPGATSSWSDVTWSDVLATADVTWEDAADSEVAPPEGTPLALTPEEEAAALADPDLGPRSPEHRALLPLPKRGRTRAGRQSPGPCLTRTGDADPLARPYVETRSLLPLRLRTD